MSAPPPYRNGDLVELSIDGELPRPALVTAAIVTTSLDPDRRWRLMCRWQDDGTPVEAPLYCRDDGIGPCIRPLGGRATADASDHSSSTKVTSRLT